MNSSIYGTEIIGNSLKIGDTLVISDLHFGYESSLNSEGLMIPYFQFDELLESLDEIQKRAHAKRIILNGDIKHNFAGISSQEWKEVLSFIDYLSDIFTEIRVVKGNHDNFTQYILNKRDLMMEEYIIVDNYLIVHGHRIPDEIPSIVDTIIIGHEHPCIGVRNGERIEKVKAFLKGKWKTYNLVVLPSFTTVTHGSDVLHEKTISPFVDDVSDFEVIAVEGYNVYDFGMVKDILAVEEEMNNY
ncbi:MAG: phosphoesterase [Methanosphaera sp. rholeuAM270]|nr:MAG: phosphoesterase [Methanosphaera sp. rholeuAM270]